MRAPGVRCEAPRAARRPTRGTWIPTIGRPCRRWIATATTGSPTSTGTGERFVSDGDQGTITVASGSTSKLGCRRALLQRRLAASIALAREAHGYGMAALMA